MKNATSLALMLLAIASASACSGGGGASPSPSEGCEGAECPENNRDDPFDPLEDPEPEGAPEPSPEAEPDDPVPDPGLLQSCHDAPLPSGLPTRDFNHTASELLARVGDPGHTSQDVFTTDLRDAIIPGKFAYGIVSKDLEDEQIEVWLDDCSGAYVKLGESTTDGDGRVSFRVPREALPPLGSYGVFLRVVGDGSSTRSVLQILPVGTRLIVFDIDETLTTDDLELFSDLFDDFFEPISTGEYDPEERAGGREITHLRFDQGYVILYLTGRPYWLTDRSRQWIADHDLAPGNLHVTDSDLEVIPNEGGVGDYKTLHLELLQEMGFVLDGAYGNAPTDIYAYGNANIPLERTWILGSHGGEGGTQAIGDDYLDHLPEASAEPMADQPFAR